jgi:hypothetical protein
VAFRESNERMNQLLAADMEDSEQSQSLQQGGDAADADPLQR